jgi:hypothetical protein
MRPDHDGRILGPTPIRLDVNPLAQRKSRAVGLMLPMASNKALDLGGSPAAANVVRDGLGHIDGNVVAENESATRFSVGGVGRRGPGKEERRLGKRRARRHASSYPTTPQRVTDHPSVKHRK